MKFYLSSYKIGNETQRLQGWLSGKTVGYIPNAGDFSKADPVKSTEVTERDTQSLRELGINVEILNLRDFFGERDALREKLKSLSGIWIRGGNTFVLRQAMKLSGLDELLTKELRDRDDFVYGGYSAAGCVLSPSLKCYQIVDDPTETPYEDWKVVLWDGLSLIDFAFMPHFDSNHSESDDIEKEIAYCKENGIPYKALRDGDVLIIE